MLQRRKVDARARVQLLHSNEPIRRRRRVHLSATDGGGIIKCARVCAACEVLTCSTRPRLVHALYPACYYWVGELRKAATAIYTARDCKAATFSRARRMHSWPRCTRCLSQPPATSMQPRGLPQEHHCSNRRARSHRLALAHETYTWHSLRGVIQDVRI